MSGIANTVLESFFESHENLNSRFFPLLRHRGLLKSRSSFTSLHYVSLIKEGRGAKIRCPMSETCEAVLQHSEVLVLTDPGLRHHQDLGKQ